LAVEGLRQWPIGGAAVYGDAFAQTDLLPSTMTKIYTNLLKPLTVTQSHGLICARGSEL